MKLSLPVVMAAVIALAACRKAEQASAASPPEGKAGQRHSPGEGKPKEAAGAGAVLQMAKRGEIRGGNEYEQLVKAIQGLSDPDIRELLRKLHETRNSQEDRLTYATAIGELARRDPKGVLKFFPPEELVRGEAGCTTVIPILAEIRPDVLKDWILNDLKRADPAVQAEWLDYALGSLSNTEPAATFEFAKTLGDGRLANGEVILAIFADFAQQSPREALAAADAYYKGQDLQYAYYNIALGTEDLALKIEIAGKVANRENRGRLIGFALLEWLKKDRAAALAKLDQLPSADLQAALAQSSLDRDSLVATLSKEDPEALASMLGKVMPSTSTAGLFENAVDHLARTDPAKAMAFLQTLPEGEMRLEALRSYFHVTAAKDSTTALAEAARLEDPQARARAMEGIGWVIGERGREETLKAAAALAPGDQSAFMDTALQCVSHKDPKDAAEILATASLQWEAAVKQEWLTHVAWRLNEVDATYTREWLAKLPEDDQPYAMKGIATEMAKADIRGLADMLGSMPRDGKWAAAVGVLIENLEDVDTKHAAEWQARLTEAGF